jgi:thiol-disulfide isomerase/thioredoxin
LIDVVGWKGKPVNLSEFKGKYVLLEFWGYWCGPCVASMPVLIELHEKYADKGLAIVGVHVDGNGEVDTALKLEEKVASYVKESWKGKTIPFSVALASGKRIGEGDSAKRGGPPLQYGVQHYPTCILIDRDGNVVDEFNAQDIKEASAEIEKLLEKSEKK